VDLIGGEAGIAPGQACVFYEDDSEDTRVLGGGFIDRAEREASIEAAIGNMLQAGVAA
jgi:tRNA-specific 2-thiouridylase